MRHAKILVLFAVCLSAMSAGAQAESSYRNGGGPAEKAPLERQAKSRRLYVLARTQYQLSNYSQARMFLNEALRADPHNQDALDMLKRVSEEYGAARVGTASAIQKMNEERKIAVQARLVELHNQLDSARQLIKAADALKVKGRMDPELVLAKKLSMFNQSREKLDRANELIKFMPFKIDVSAESKEWKKLNSLAVRRVSATSNEINQIRQLRGVQKVKQEQMNIEQIQQQKVRTILEQAWVLYERGEFARTRALASQVLHVDPTNSEALSLRKKSRTAEFKYRQREIDRNMKFHQQWMWLRNDTVSTPIREYIRFPSDWREKQGTRGLSSRIESAAPQWKKNIQQSLSKPVSFEFNDQSLGEAIEFLSALTHVTFVINPKVIEAGLQNTPINLRANEMAAQDALEWILHFASLEYDLRDQAVFIYSPEEAVQQLTLEIYDIRDITYVKPQFRGPLIESVLMTQDQGGFGNVNESVMKITDISELIQQFVEPVSWTVEGATIEVHESTGKLFVMQTEEVHKKINAFLSRLRERQVVQIGIQVRFIEVRENFLDEVGIYFTGLDSDTGYAAMQHGVGGANPYLGVQRNTRSFNSRGDRISLVGGDVALTSGADNNYQLRFSPYHTRRPSGPYGMRDYLGRSLALGESIPRTRANPLNSQSSLGYSVYGATGGQPVQGMFLQYRYAGSMLANAILHALKKSQTADQLNAPRLTVFNNQSAFVLMGQENAYVMDYQVSGELYDPVIGTYLIGNVLNIRPVVSHDRRYITMEIEPGVASLYGLRQVPIAAPVTIYIELPDMSVRSVRTMATIPDRGSLLLSGMIIDNRADMHSGIPLLMHLPILGRLFSTHYEERERQNLLVMVTGRIILFDEEEANLAN